MHLVIHMHLCGRQGTHACHSTHMETRGKLGESVLSPHYSGSWDRSQDIRCGGTFTAERPHQLRRPLTCGLLTAGSSPSQVSGISSQLCPCVLSLTPIFRPAQVFLMSPSVACFGERPIIYFLIDALAFSNQLPEIHHVPLF